MASCLHPRCTARATHEATDDSAEWQRVCDEHLGHGARGGASFVRRHPRRDRSDATIAKAIVDGQYGAQRIASRIVRRVPGPDGALPLDASFAFFGQRYCVDSHVFSNVVYDRVATRVLPSPLDAAFAAFGNDHAVALLSSELEQHPYAGALASMRALVDAHPSEY